MNCIFLAWNFKYKVSQQVLVKISNLREIRILKIFDREKRSYRGPTSGSYAPCDFVYLIDYIDFIIL